VDSPAKADLVFQLRSISPITDVVGVDGGTYSITSPAFQIKVLDPKTDVSLWTITSPVNLPRSRKQHSQWFALAVTNAVSRVKVLAGEPLSPTETAELTEIPKDHRRAEIFLIVGATAGAGVAAGLILRHEYDNSVANQDAAACASNPYFCNTPAMTR